MSVILQQVFVLYIFLFVGWLLGRTDKQLCSHTRILSGLMVKVFLPCKIINSLSGQFTLERLIDKSSVLLVSVAMLVTLHFLAKLLARLVGKEAYERKVYEYSMTISNYGYMGYALIESVFGEAVLADMIFFCIPFSVYTYTVGYLKLTNKTFEFKRLLNPMTVAIVIGLSLGVSGLKLPSFIQQVLVSSSACAGPISMLLVGLVLSGFVLRKLFLSGRDYIIIALRLVLLPGLVFLSFNLLGLSAILPSALFVAAMPTGLNPIVFAQSTGNSPEIGARLAFLSHLFSLATLPLWLLLVQQFL